MSRNIICTEGFIKRNEQLAEIHAKKLELGNRNRATLAVARKLLVYMLAVERRETAFEVMTMANIA